MTTTKRLAADPGKGPILTLALIFFAVFTWASYARWANFEYRTFDLAYYVQSIWQLIHGRFQASVEGVPLLGNHVEPIILLIAPVFAFFRHPMIFVIIQNAALASMGPVAFRIAQRLGFDGRNALLLASATLLTPATGYVALHEFHPEAFTAPFFLLMFYARLRSSLRGYWVWLLAVLACKENMALLIVSYCGVQIVLEHKRPVAHLFVWDVLPIGLAIAWFLICVQLITPALNSGNIDYLALYDRLGTSGKDILLNAIKEPYRIVGALSQSLSQGNLVWALLLPFLAVPVLRPQWLLVATPILLQHLLSWRSSEWTIYFHYAAPLVPVFWIALAEGLRNINNWSWVPTQARHLIPYLVVVTCVAAQIFLGPIGSVSTTAANWFTGEEMRGQKQEFISRVPADASVVAPLPYLSHLAMRERLYSLHYILKGLKTLSRSAYLPPSSTDFVLIDYGDSATFDPTAGYYHPVMGTVDGRLIPSSDQLLHQFLARTSWEASASDQLTVLEQTTRKESPPSGTNVNAPITISKGSTLVSITKSGDEFKGEGLDIHTIWDFQEPREVFPWMILRLIPRDQEQPIIFSRGLCGPEATQGLYRETWQITFPEKISKGEYGVEVFFVDNTKLAWTTKLNQPDLKNSLLSPPISLGSIKVAKGTRNLSRD